MKIYWILALTIFFTVEMFSQNRENAPLTREFLSNGIGLGSIIAGVTSWERNKSVLWLIIHGILSWFYVVYFLLTRKKTERK